MIRLLRQGQHTSPTLHGCDQTCDTSPRQIEWRGYRDCFYFYYCGALCFAPRRSRQK